MEYHNINLRNQFFDNLFLNVQFSITMAYRDFKFRLHTLNIYSEGRVSQIFNLGLSFIFMSKNGKHFPKFVSIIFEVTYNIN